MTYEVLARKWRPQQFADVIGQRHITQTLVNAIERGRVAHAYLFVGPRGTGKTSTARIFAKALNCENGPTATPCDKCNSCLEIMGGHSLDVIEIDGASNNSVDQVRDLCESAQYVPVRGPCKIYIIDEVHMLSAAAFNALLKTLEEPPPHVKFLFATTEPQKVLSTITSRCQRFDLRRISTQDIMEHLRKISDEEGIVISDDALLAIARGAEGGLRDAESALDQLTAFCGEKIGEEDVLSVFGLVSRKELDELTSALLKGEIGSLISLIDQMDKRGRNIQGLVFELIDHFKNLLVYIHVKDAVKVMDIADAQVKTLESQKELVRVDRIVEIVENLTELEGHLRYALSPRTLLETTLIKCARAAKIVSLDEILEKLNSLSSASDADGGVRERTSVYMNEPPAKKKVLTKQPVGSVPPPRDLESSPGKNASAGKKSFVADPGVDFDRELKSLLEDWNEICESFGHVVPACRKTLKDTRPVSLEADWLVIGVDSEFYDDDLKSIESSRSKVVLQQIIKERLNREIWIKFKQIDVLPQSPDNNSGNAGVASVSERTPREWCEEPIVQKTMDMFDGKISDLRI